MMNMKIVGSISMFAFLECSRKTTAVKKPTMMYTSKIIIKMCILCSLFHEAMCETHDELLKALVEVTDQHDAPKERHDDQDSQPLAPQLIDVLLDHGKSEADAHDDVCQDGTEK